MKKLPLAVVLVLSAFIACKRPPAAASGAKTGRGWYVYKDGKPVQWIDDKPGPLSSAAIPRPGTPIVTHPFITASSMSAMDEDPLARALSESKSFAEYVEKVQKAGYEVKPKTGNEAD